MVLNQRSTRLDHIRRFGVVEPNGFDVLLQPFFTQGENLFGRASNGIKLIRGFVHRYIRRLRRQDDCDQKFESAVVAQFCRRSRVFSPKPFQNFVTLVFVQF